MKYIFSLATSFFIFSTAISMEHKPQSYLDQLVAIRVEWLGLENQVPELIKEAEANPGKQRIIAKKENIIASFDANKKIRV